jgi:hypothetical protein
MEYRNVDVHLRPFLHNPEQVDLLSRGLWPHMRRRIHACLALVRISPRRILSRAQTFSRAHTPFLALTRAHTRALSPPRPLSLSLSLSPSS